MKGMQSRATQLRSRGIVIGMEPIKTLGQSSPNHAVPHQRVLVEELQAARPSVGLRPLPWVALLVDSLCIAGAVILAAIGRNHAPMVHPQDVELTGQLMPAAPAIAVGWLVTLALFGVYDRRVFGVGTEEFNLVWRASFATAAAVGIGCYVLKFQLSRGFFVLAFAIGIPVLLVGRAALRTALKTARKRGVLRRRVLIVGTESHIDDIAEVLSRETWLGLEVVGALTPAGLVQETATGVPVLGRASTVAHTSVSVHADVVFFAGGAVESASELRHIAWELESENVHVVIAPTLTDVSSERIRVRPVGGLPLIHLEKPRSAAAVRSAKRTFDILGSGLLLAGFAPLLLFVALRIWLHDRGSVLFRHERIGRDNQPFACWKFRTMVEGAQDLQATVHAEQGTEEGVFAKIKCDPRVTRPGRWLRRFSIDELPQLVNVLRGDMSLVGPRPQVAQEVALYDRAMSRRLRVRPGMTGLWQVSGRSDLTASESIRLDLYYVDNWSMMRDVAILARTARAVLSSRGAY